ncbi:hypothetical protein BRADI_3g56593v3 [Brachypodium distachyon]|uniref:Uncharacterized protein n=1 Tax=Brachypodium distachyon TaxID=15368 RepID=A0A0Q3FR22_BRADI|nr:hypothetical protein BRADI_3g56593v3 [Brachypodium distachyon]KQK01544.1 hypothetical protein BRADI_3g56593v3 [Brachypodium distachyon]
MVLQPFTPTPCAQEGRAPWPDQPTTSQRLLIPSSHASRCRRHPVPPPSSSRPARPPPSPVVVAVPAWAHAACRVPATSVPRRPSPDPPIPKGFTVL